MSRKTVHPKPAVYAEVIQRTRPEAAAAWAGAGLVCARNVKSYFR